MDNFQAPQHGIRVLEKSPREVSVPSRLVSAFTDSDDAFAIWHPKARALTRPVPDYPRYVIVGLLVRPYGFCLQFIKKMSSHYLLNVSVMTYLDISSGVVYKQERR
jgi:hypothetical protein